MCSGLWWPFQWNLSPHSLGSTRHLRNWSHLQFFTNTWPFLLSASLFVLTLQPKVSFQISSFSRWCPHRVSMTPGVYLASYFKDCPIVMSHLFGFWDWVSLYTCHLGPLPELPKRGQYRYVLPYLCGLYLHLPKNLNHFWEDPKHPGIPMHWKCLNHKKEKGMCYE